VRRGPGHPHLALRGRIYDWHRKDRGVSDIPIADDPGVASVAKIYSYFKKFDYKTEIMGASFRKMDQVVALAGCDLLTISPELLAELRGCEGALERRLSPESAKAGAIDRIHLDEKSYRWLHNQDPMAVDKLAEASAASTRTPRSWGAGPAASSPPPEPEAQPVTLTSVPVWASWSPQKPSRSRATQPSVRPSTGVPPAWQCSPRVTSAGPHVTPSKRRRRRGWRSGPSVRPGPR